jgi:cyanate permease
MTDANTPLESEAGRRADLGAFKAVTAFLALATVVAAGLVSFVHERLHLSADDARLLASALLVIGIGDTLVLYYWNKIFRS